MWIVSAIRRIEPDHSAFAAEIFERRFIFLDQCDDDLPVSCGVGAADERVIAIEDAGLDHRIARHFERIMFAATEQRAWWERSWFEWPRAVRRLAGAATGITIASLVGSALLLLNLDWLLGIVGSASEAWGVIGALGNALALLGRAVPASALLAAGVLLAASYLCAIALGTVFFRYACQRRLNSHP